MLKPLFRGRKLWPHALADPTGRTDAVRVCRPSVPSRGLAGPHRINVDWQLNAAAGCEGWGDLIANRVVLNIGAPLIAGLDAGQFAGVLASRTRSFHARRLAGD